MTPEQFVSEIDTQLLVVPWLHCLHPPVATEEHERWIRAHTGHILPPDLVAFYQHTNGLSLCRIRHGTEIVGEAFVVPPLREIQPVCFEMYGQRGRDHSGIPRHWLAVGRHTDGTYFVALDPRSSTYRSIAPIVPDEAEVIGTSCGEYLSWMLQFLPETEELNALAQEHAT